MQEAVQTTSDMKGRMPLRMLAAQGRGIMRDVRNRRGTDGLGSNRGYRLGQTRDQKTTDCLGWMKSRLDRGIQVIQGSRLGQRGLFGQSSRFGSRS